MINLVVMDDAGRHMCFKVKTGMRLGCLFAAYAKRTAREMSSLFFTFDGERLCESHTPAYLDMEDGDSTDVRSEQLGD